MLVAMPHSLHVARICAALTQEGWEVYLFPSVDAPPHPELRDIVLFDPGGVRSRPDALEVRRTFPGTRELAAKGPVRALSLALAVRDVRPLLIHAHEIQFSGYVTVAAKKLMLGRFPPIVLSAWGSDIALQSRRPAERRRIVDTLNNVDVFTGECERDLHHARRLGFRGETALPQPIVAGFDIARLRALRAPGPTSSRRAIAVKAYQGWAGRAQVALRAMELCGARLRGYRVGLYLADAAETQLARMLAHEIGFELDIFNIYRKVPHDEVLALHGSSRVSIGLSIADGISTSFLEALVMGSFPIQSNTACVDEWIENGVTGAIVPPEDPNTVAAALSRALEDDDLVDRAVNANDATVTQRLSVERISRELSRLYERVAEGLILRAGA